MVYHINMNICIYYECILRKFSILAFPNNKIYNFIRGFHSANVNTFEVTSINVKIVMFPHLWLCFHRR